MNGYNPREDEREKASNGYLMSVMAVMVGMPLPIINLLATVIFYIANRRATYFVKWHCTQAMISQFTIFIMNSVGFSWTMHIIFGEGKLTNSYLAYLATIFLFNVAELIVNIATATKVRKGIHSEWWFWGPLTTLLLQKKKQP
ncbi:MAG: hypothetical protein EOP51_05385 [Sphingobacteriales bacterium]|nr:MAG: hypothetical protein EOP51_05385 [Sphingobacteriales bacterium]